MTDKEKLEKIKALADKMYSRMAHLTTDTRPIRQAMDEYHQFIINEYHKEEPVSEELDEAASRYAKEEYSRKNPATLPDRCIGCYAPIRYAFRNGANWQKEQLMAKAVDGEVGYWNLRGLSINTDLPRSVSEGDKAKIIVIKED